MAAHIDESDHIVVSVDEARGAVTGHNVRYVLAFGMTGVILAFAAVALYEGYEALSTRMAGVLSQSPSALLQAFAPYTAIVLMGAVGAGLLLGLWSLLAGRSGDESERFMRARVVLQFAAVCVIMGIFYMTTT
jgi:hypothetical protein